MLVSLLSYSGLIAAIWIVFSISLTGYFYPKFNHKTQFCSELGAINSPTQQLTPIINHYPLGILFLLFGGYIIQLHQTSVWITLIGSTIAIHGVATWVAGYFPMDNDPYTRSPSLSGRVHSWAGFILFLSLLFPPILCLFSAEFSLTFKFGSLVSIILSVYFTRQLTQAYQAKTTPGLYQRLCYGTQLIWLSALSIILR